jgi:hypothetical protein
VSAVETPQGTEPAPAPEERRCPRCGASLTPEQEWCLECGADVGTVVAGPRGWHWPLAVVGVLLALAAIAVVLAFVELAGDAERVTEAPATPTPGAPAPTPSPTPGTGEPTATPGTPTPEGEATVEPPAGGPVASWPGGTAWTIVVNSSGTREDAERIANELSAKGVPVGVLDSNEFQSLGPDSFVVFSGQYQSRQEADDALAAIRAQAGGGSARRIVPKRP